jgi:hypothetical protein
MKGRGHEMRFLTKLILKILVLGLLAGGAQSLAQTVYVNQRRCDEGDGTLARPYRTLSRAVDNAPDGGTLVIQAGSYPEKDRLPLLIGKSGKRLTIEVAGGPVEVGRVYTERIAQLTGNFDPEGKPHINDTVPWGVGGVDLGANTEHCDKDGQNCKLYIFFGDVPEAGDGDLIASTEDTNPEPNGFKLKPVLRGGNSGPFYPFTFRALDGTLVTTGTNETPTGAFSYDGKAYVFCYTSDHRSHLTVSGDPSQPNPFDELFELSSKFFQVAPLVVRNAEIPGLPANPGQVDGLIMFGHGVSECQASDCAFGVQLAWMPLPPDKSQILYYKGGSDPSNRWSPNEQEAKTLFSTEKRYWTSLSVGRIPGTGQWVLLYQRTLSEIGQDQPIVARTGALPWELSDEVEVFNPYREGAYGRYMFGCPEPAFAYGAYLLNRYTRWNAAEQTATIYYLMSTGTPYQVQLMRSVIRIAK